MALLSGGGMALTVSAWRTTSLVADRSTGDPWPLAYALYGTLALLGLVLVSLGWVIGKTSIKGSVAGAEFDLGGGEADAAVAAQVVADVAQETADVIKDKAV
jgi:hypothetical protein